MRSRIDHRAYRNHPAPRITPSNHPTRVQSFKKCLRIEEIAGEALDRFYERHYAVEKIGEDGKWTVDQRYSQAGLLQKLGYDRIFINRKTGQHLSVQYKVEPRARDRAFIETISNVQTGELGWSRSCLAQYIIHCIPHEGVAHWFEMTVIARALRDWHKRYPTYEAPDKLKKSKGICVPLNELRRLALRCDRVGVITLDDVELKEQNMTARFPRLAS